MFETNGHPLGGFWFFKQKMKTIQKMKNKTKFAVVLLAASAG